MGLDATWKIEGRKITGTAYTTRWTGAPGKSIPAHGYFLIGNSTGYTELPGADAVLSSGITDSTSLRLVHAATPIDAVCYYATGVAPTAFDITFTCKGTPVSNAPHTDGGSAASDVDVSIERKPCTDTGDNAADFVAAMPATPQSTTSAPTP